MCLAPACKAAMQFISMWPSMSVSAILHSSSEARCSLKKEAVHATRATRSANGRDYPGYTEAEGRGQDLFLTVENVTKLSKVLHRHLLDSNKAVRGGIVESAVTK